jgi:ABC-type multidrug transport system fused ATPase/permease subunit
MSHILLKGWHRYKERGKYSWKSSLVIALVATILLWWLPIFGPMFSGYVSGRTSGSKYKGVVITALVAAIIGVVSFLFSYVIAVPGSVSYFLSSTIVYHLHTVSPYGAWFLSSMGQMFTNFQYYLSFFPPNWAVLVAFGFIGGAMSELLVKDTEKKSVLSAKHPVHSDVKALTPKEIDYAPAVDPHPLLKRIIRDKEAQESSEDYI